MTEGSGPAGCSDPLRQSKSRGARTLESEDRPVDGVSRCCRRSRVVSRGALEIAIATNKDWRIFLYSHAPPPPPLPRRSLRSRQHDHPIPHRSPRRIQPFQSSLEARTIIPLAHSCRCTLQWHACSVDHVAPDKQGECYTGRKV